MKKLFLLASLLMAFGISADAGDITSPNGQIKVNFTLDGTVPTYSVTYQGKTIIKPSRLGYQLAKGGKDGKDLLSDFSVINEKTSVQKSFVLVIFSLNSKFPSCSVCLLWL